MTTMYMCMCRPQYSTGTGTGHLPYGYLLFLQADAPGSATWLLAPRLHPARLLSGLATAHDAVLSREARLRQAFCPEEERSVAAGGWRWEVQHSLFFPRGMASSTQHPLSSACPSLLAPLETTCTVAGLKIPVVSLPSRRGTPVLEFSVSQHRNRPAGLGLSFLHAFLQLTGPAHGGHTQGKGAQNPWRGADSLSFSRSAVTSD